MKSASERPFRILAAVLGLFDLAVRVHYRRKAGRVTKTLSEYDQQDKSPRGLPTYVSYPVLLYIVTPWVDFAHLPLPLWLRRLGAVLTCAGSALFLWTHHALGSNWSGKLELADDHAVVMTGPYRYVRHPMYAGFFLGSVGDLLMTANWLVSMPPLLAQIWMYLARVDAEEAMMTERFGDTYREYMARTGRLLPRLSMFRSSSAH